MIIVGGADEMIVFYVHKIPYILDLARDSVDVRLGSDARFLCEVLYLLTVLVGTCAKEYVLAHSPLKSCIGVAHNYLVFAINYIEYFFFRQGVISKQYPKS